jgi:hypothetical protein
LVGDQLFGSGVESVSCVSYRSLFYLVWQCRDVSWCNAVQLVVQAPEVLCLCELAVGSSLLLIFFFYRWFGSRLRYSLRGDNHRSMDLNVSDPVTGQIPPLRQIHISVVRSSPTCIDTHTANTLPVCKHKIYRSVSERYLVCPD